MGPRPARFAIDGGPFGIKIAAFHPTELKTGTVRADQVKHEVLEATKPRATGHRFVPWRLRG
jgi:hypothetical protein